MNYRILNKEKQQIKGSAYFHVDNFIVYFGLSEKGKVRATDKTTQKEVLFENMEECFSYISGEKQRQFELDNY